MENFTFDGITVYGQAGPGWSTFHSTATCRKIISGTAVHVFSRYGMTERQLCSCCSAAFLAVADSDVAARIRMYDARIRRMLATLASEPGSASSGDLANAARELNTMASLLSRANTRREELVAQATAAVASHKEALLTGGYVR